MDTIKEITTVNEALKVAIATNCPFRAAAAASCAEMHITWLLKYVASFEAEEQESQEANAAQEETFLLEF